MTKDKAAEQTTSESTELYNADQAQGEAYFKPQNPVGAKDQQTVKAENVEGSKPSPNVLKQKHRS